MKELEKKFGVMQFEEFKNEDLIKEKYNGIRPAPGYTACPDHTEKLKSFLNFRMLK